MNTYIISIVAKKGSSHTEGQAFCSAMMTNAGIHWDDKIWIMGRGRDEHHWKIKCTEEQLTLMVLKGAKVEKNVTKEARESGLAKLTEDEKEALGLNIIQPRV